LPTVIRRDIFPSFFKKEFHSFIEVRVVGMESFFFLWYEELGVDVALCRPSGDRSPLFFSFFGKPSALSLPVSFLFFFVALVFSFFSGHERTDVVPPPCHDGDGNTACLSPG